MLEDQTRLEFAPHGFTCLPLLADRLLVRCLAAGPGGRPLRVLIDTGCDPSAIDLQLAQRLGLRIGAFAAGDDGLGRHLKFTETTLPWLRLGDLTLRDLYLLAFDLRSRPFGCEIVLGYNVLSQLNLTIDYVTQTLTLRHPDLAPPADGTALPLTFVAHQPALADAQLHGPQPIALPLLTLDTGSNAGLTVSSVLADQLGLTPNTGLSGHAFGHSSGLRSGAAGLQIGRLALHDVALDSPLSRSGALGAERRANAGNRLLARFGRLSLDYRRAVCVVDHDQGKPA
jgi:predicted aspartyl protease